MNDAFAFGQSIAAPINNTSTEMREFSAKVFRLPRRLLSCLTRNVLRRLTLLGCAWTGPDWAKEAGEGAMAGRVRMSRALLQTRTIGMEADAA